MRNANYNSKNKQTETLKDGLERLVIGGGGEIRTHDGLTPTPVFKTGAFNRSATPPTEKHYTEAFKSWLVLFAYLATIQRKIYTRKRGNCPVFFAINH